MIHNEGEQKLTEWSEQGDSIVIEYFYKNMAGCNDTYFVQSPVSLKSTINCWRKHSGDIITASRIFPAYFIFNRDEIEKCKEYASRYHIFCLGIEHSPGVCYIAYPDVEDFEEYFNDPFDEGPNFFLFSDDILIHDNKDKISWKY
jgi:hypothetical protein